MLNNSYLSFKDIVQQTQLTLKNVMSSIRLYVFKTKSKYFPSRNQSEDFAQNDADNLFIEFCPLLSNKIKRAICVVLNT